MTKYRDSRCIRKSPQELIAGDQIEMDEGPRLTVTAPAYRLGEGRFGVDTDAKRMLQFDEDTVVWVFPPQARPTI